MVLSTASTSKTVLNDAFPRIEGQSPTLDAARQSILTSSRPPIHTLAWLCFLDLLPIDDDASWKLKLQQSRNAYEQLKLQHCRKPDGSWIAELSLPSEGDGQGSSSSQSKDHSTVGDMHPLGQGDSHPWQQYYMALASLEQIQLDVSRHTEIDDAVAQVAIARILFLWAKEHPVIAYRQGMHELVAALWIVRRKEASTCDLLDSKHVEHDTYAIFDLLMVRLRPLYEWKTQSPPILKITEDVRSQLASVDPALSTHLADVEFQLFTLRWLRLLFLREVHMDTATQLWDVGFSHADKLIEVLTWVCVALLVRLRSQLLAQDPLLVLMRPIDESMASQPHLLVRQALSLSSNPTPAAGVQCVIENNRQLGIEIYNPRESQAGAASPTQASAATNLPSVRQLYAQKLASQLPRAYQGAAWAYANAYQSLASARAAVDDDPTQGGFPSGWGQRQQRGPTGAATAEAEVCRYRERDASLAAALDTVVASLQEERSSSSISSSTTSVADRQKHSFNDSLTALIMVRDSLLGRVNANDTVNALKSLALNGDKSRGGRRSPEQPAAQKLSTSPAQESSPRTAQPKIHRAFQRMPSPPRAPQPSRPVASSSEPHSRSPKPSPSPQEHRHKEDTSISRPIQQTAPTKTTSQGWSTPADDDPLGVGGGR